MSTASLGLVSDCCERRYFGLYILRLNLNPYSYAYENNLNFGQARTDNPDVVSYTANWYVQALRTYEHLPFFHCKVYPDVVELTVNSSA